MTLALYGKSRKRQGGLLLAALLAIIGATVGGLLIIGTAFAHANGVSGVSTCQQDGTYKITWTIANDYNATETVNKVALNGTSTSALLTAVNPNPLAKNGSATLDTTVPGTSTSATLDVWARWSDGYPKVGDQGYTVDGRKDSGSVSMDGRCGQKAKIIIKKVVTGDGASTSQSFTANVKNTKHSAGTTTGLTFSKDAPKTYEFDSTNSNDDFDVSEVNLPVGYALNKAWSSAGDKSCPPTTGRDSNSWGSPGGTNNDTAPSLTDVGNGDTFTVCFWNVYSAGHVQVHKYVPMDNDQTPWQNVGNGQSSYEFTIYKDQAMTQPVTTFSQLGSNSGDLPQDIDLWIKETGTNGQNFAGFFFPDGDGDSSGNAKCNKQPADGSAFSASVPTKIAKTRWGTPGNLTGLLHICAYNKPAPAGTLIVKKVADPSGVTSDAAAQFGGNVASSPAKTWGNIGLGGSSTVSNVPVGTWKIDEATINSGSTGWSLVGFAAANNNEGHTCPTSSNAYSKDGSFKGDVTVTANATTYVCVMNTKQAAQLGRKIRIGKVSNNSHPAETFTGTIVPGGVPTTFSIGIGANATAGTIVDYSMDSQTSQTVTETNLPANWTLNGYFVTSDPNGTGTCAQATGFSTSVGANVVPAGSGTYLVCIKNTYTPPPTGRTVTVCKVMDDNGNGIPTEGGTFGFHLDDGSQTHDDNLTAKEGDAADAHCKTYDNVSSTHSVTITESLPTNWDSAANYPTVTGASSVNGMTATVNAGTAAATVTFHNKLNAFSGACYIEGGSFLTTTGPFASTGYWFGLNTYDYFNGDGHNPGFPVDPNGATAGNAFDHRWVQVVDNGSGNKLVWKLASGQGTNSVTVYPSIDHNDAGGTTGGSIAGEANEYFVWGSNDGVTWEQATGAAFFDPTPGTYIADNAARVFTFPGGHVWNQIGISVNVAAGVGTDAEIDAVCGKAEALSRTVTVKKVVEGADNDSTQFALNLDGSPSGKSVSEPTDVTFTLDQSEHSISEVVSTGYSYVTSYYTKNGECSDERILGQLQSLVSNILAFEDLTDTSVKVPAGLDDYTVCFVNAKDPVVVVHKTWVGGSHTESDIPVITIEDSSQTYHPTVKTDGGNSTLWNSQTTNLGEIVVSEDLGANSKWKVTASSNDCSFDQVAIENAEDLSSQTFQAGPGDVCNVYFTNTLMTGSIVVHKQITTTQPADGTTFSGTVNGSNSFAWGPITAGGSDTLSDVPVGSATVEENPSLNGWNRANLLYILSSGTQACPTDPAAYTATSVTVTDGGTAHVCVLNDQAAEQVKRTLRVGKVIVGPNPDNNTTFGGTVNPGALNWSVKNGQVQSFTNLDANVYTVAETAKAGYATVGYKVYYGGESCPSTAPASYDGTNSAVVNLTPKEQTIGLVCVYNQGLGSITVTKTTTLNGLGDTTQSAGWKITVSSAACSINQTQNTNASGVVTFTNLPTCSDYVVSEDVNSKGNSGFAPVGPSSYSGIAVTPGGNALVAFTNNRNTNPCPFGCTPVILNTPTPTPTQPTATATPTEPTQKPTEPTKTEKPSKVETPSPTIDIALGEKTPGANATPLAPQTGSGLFGTGKSGSNLLLAVMGIFSLSAGFAVIAVANKNKSRS